MEKQEKYYTILDWWKKGVFTKYATFSGRAGRAEYWYFSLVQFIIYLILFLSITIFGALQWSLWDIIFTVFLGVFIIGTLIPTWAITVRRLHDINKSGWYCLLHFIPLGSLVLFIFSILEGDQQSNRYGQDPKALTDEINLIGED